MPRVCLYFLEGGQVDLNVCKVEEAVTKDRFELCVVRLACESQATL